MIPHDYLVPYVVANSFALVVLALAFWRPTVALWMVVSVFVWAAATNTYIALTHPAVYVDYAALTPSAWYRDFILGWFSGHVQTLVLPIALGQLTIAALLASRRRAWLWCGVAGALTFLLAIAPLGVGAGFPFSLTFGAALLVSKGVAVHVPRRAQPIVWWSPRLLGMLLSAFLGVFALDAFSAGTSTLDALRDFVIHLAPASMVLAVVLLAWRWERVGGLLLFALAVGYGVMTNGRVSWMLVISLPLIVEGTLFFWSSVLPPSGRTAATSLTLPR